MHLVTDTYDVDNNKQIKRIIQRFKFWETILRNKIIVSFVSFLLVSIVGWGIWTTNMIFTYTAVADQLEKEQPKVEKLLEDLKTDQKEIRNDQKKDIQDILKLLLDIQKQIGEKNN